MRSMVSGAYRRRVAANSHIVELRRFPRYWRAEDAAGSRATTVDVILALARSGRLKSRTFGSDPVLRIRVQDVTALTDDDLRLGEKLVGEYAAADEEARRIPVRSWVLGEEATVALPNGSVVV